MPDTFEFPRVLGAVVPLMSAGDAVVLKLVTGGLPGFSAVVRALDHLAEPAAGLRRIQTIRFGGRGFNVINLPTPEVRSADFPPLALPVGGQDEGPLLCTNQHSYSAHTLIRLMVRRTNRGFLDIYFAAP